MPTTKPKVGSTVLKAMENQGKPAHEAQNQQYTSRSAPNPRMDKLDANGTQPYRKSLHDQSGQEKSEEGGWTTGGDTDAQTLRETESVNGQLERLRNQEGVDDDGDTPRSAGQGNKGTPD